VNAGPDDHIRNLLHDAVAGVEMSTPDPDQLRHRSVPTLQPVQATGPRPRGWIAIASAAAAVLVIAGGTTLLISLAHHSVGNGDAAAGPGTSTTPQTPPQSGSSASTTPATSSGATDIRGAAACTSSNLTATLDPARTGPTAGTENVVIILHNSSTSGCRLGGLVALKGLNATGAATPLAFHPSLDPGVADPSPATGPGEVMPGKDGALHITLALNNCSTPGATYRHLQIKLASGSALVMPFPNELAATGCYGYAAQPGPIPPA
jgi:hypothetical protein